MLLHAQLHIYLIPTFAKFYSLAVYESVSFAIPMRALCDHFLTLC